MWCTKRDPVSERRGGKGEREKESGVEGFTLTTFVDTETNLQLSTIKTTLAAKSKEV